MDQKTLDNEVVYHSFNKDDDNLTPTQKEENKKSNFNSEMDNNVSTHRKYSLVELDENNNVKRIIHDDVNTEILKQINMNLLDINNSNKDILRVIQDDLRRIKADISSALLMFVIFLSIIVIIIVLVFIL